MSDSPKTWEVKMNEARQMRKKCAGMLFDRVVLLIACYDDAEFRSWHESVGTNELDFLDEELSDTAVGFLTFRAVMNAYPKRKEWIDHNIRELVALTIESENEKKKRQGDEKRVSWKERALSAEAECERLRAEIASIKESLEIVASSKRS